MSESPLTTQNSCVIWQKKAAKKGLDIQVIGNHDIDQDGRRTSYAKKIGKVCIVDFTQFEKLREFISAQMKIQKKSGDTLVLFTVGHGGRGGGLHHLGQREKVMKVIASAAEENKQKTLWWQLSCFASAKLPNINSLPEAQQKLLSIVASSSAQNSSPAYVEHKVLDQMFDALAEKSKEIDPDANGSITGTELKNFLDGTKPKRGHLFYIRNMKDVVYGWRSPASMIPIRDHDSPGQRYPEEYIPLPN